ncbi:MAG: hypothetical protein ABI548_07580 [Polyangiaceae bacterium]
MRERYCLRDLRDEQLMSALSGLVKTGNALNADVLAHLAELDERKLFLELGFSSLFAYCMELLGMDESSAGRRITAARVCRNYPEVFVRVARGALGLSVLCALNPHLNPENAAQLFEACSNKSRRRVDEILAAQFPKPDVRDLIRRVPIQAEMRPIAAEPQLSSAQLEPSASRNAAPPPPVPNPRRSSDAPPRRIEPLSADRYGFHFTGNSSLKKKFEQARALLSHELPSGEMAALFERALDALISDREKRRFAVGRKPRRAARLAVLESLPPALDSRSPGECCAEPPPVVPLVPSGESARVPSGESARVQSGESARVSSGESARVPAKRSRRIPAAVARQVYARDEGRCSFVSRDGRRCNCRVFLEMDHCTPFAVNGAPTILNLRLRCRAHNQWHAVRYFGRKYVAAAIARSQRTSERAREGDSRPAAFRVGIDPDRGPGIVAPPLWP